MKAGRTGTADGSTGMLCRPGSCRTPGFPR